MWMRGWNQKRFNQIKIKNKQEFEKEIAAA